MIVLHAKFNYFLLHFPVTEPTVRIRVLWEPTVPASNTITPYCISQLSLKAYLFVPVIQRSQQTKSQRF
jgi:hypothetical protein